MTSYKSLLIAITTLLSLSSAKTLSVPKGKCTAGYSTYFTYNNNGACGYKSLTGITGPGYLYGIGANQAFYNKSEKCGICYEVVGPKGAVRAMVVDMCPADSANPLCHGQHIHFDMTKEAFSIIGYEDTGGANITFREVSCDVDGPVKVHVNEGSSEWWMSLLVFNHALGVSKLEYYMDGKWVVSQRSDSNHWVIVPKENSVLTCPINVRITSKYGSTVTVSVASYTPGSVYSANGQFPVGSSVSKECCETPDTFSTIYSDSLASGWSDWSYYVTNNLAYASNPHSGSKCLETAFKAYGQITLGTGTPALSSQYSSVSFWVRGTPCTNCFGVSAVQGADGKKVTMSITQNNVWEKKTFTFDSIGVVDGKFYGLVVQENAGQAVTYYFDDIGLGKNAGTSSKVCPSTTTLITEGEESSHTQKESSGTSKGETPKVEESSYSEHWSQGGGGGGQKSTSESKGQGGSTVVVTSEGSIGGSSISDDSDDEKKKGNGVMGLKPLVVMIVCLMFVI